MTRDASGSRRTYSAALCCALLHAERTISEICVPNSGFRAHRAAYLHIGFPRVITCPCLLHIFALALRSIIA